MTAPAAVDAPDTLADLLARLGGVAPERILLHPPPGEATERDVVRLTRQHGRLYELVDGVIVEKTMGIHESMLAVWIGHLLHAFLASNDLGEVTGADGSLRLMPGLVRIPDVAFFRRERFPKGRLPDDALPTLAPDLAIEVLSKSNRPGEMTRKVGEYFQVGAQLVWLVDPVARTVEVFSAPDVHCTLGEEDALDGGDVLPGLSLPVRRIFERLPPSQGRSA